MMTQIYGGNYSKGIANVSNGGDGGVMMVVVAQWGTIIAVSGLEWYALKPTYFQIYHRFKQANVHFV